MAGLDGLTGGSTGGLPAAYTAVGSSSFVEFLGQAAPDLLPGRRPLPPGQAADLSPHATTIIALTFDGGVLMAGDRRATMGNLISQRDIEKVFPADDHSVVGFAGTAGIGIELMRLFQIELEHYEKINEASLSLDGKANRLATLVRGNLPMAMQGLVALPLFAGYDVDADDPARAGRIFSYDATGGGYEERYFHGVGSGSLFARGSLKKTWRLGIGRDEAVRVAVDALYDAADEDSATGGPDTVRRLYPIVYAVDADGARRVDDAQIATIAEAVIAERTANPGS